MNIPQHKCKLNMLTQTLMEDQALGPTANIQIHCCIF